MTHATVSIRPAHGLPCPIKAIRLSLPAGLADLSPAALWARLGPALTVPALMATTPEGA